MARIMSALVALKALCHGDPGVADLVHSFGATLERERLIPDDLDVYRKVLRWLMNFAEQRPEQLQPVRWHAFARALDIRCRQPAAAMAAPQPDVR